MNQTVTLTVSVFLCLMVTIIAIASWVVSKFIYLINFKKL